MDLKLCQDPADVAGEPEAAAAEWGCPEPPRSALGLGQGAHHPPLLILILIITDGIAQFQVW